MKHPVRPALVSFTRTGGALASRLADGLEADVLDFNGQSGGAAEKIRAMFAGGRPIIGICAAGILIRILAPVLGDKHAEPPVFAVSQDARHVVPLLGWHHGGADLGTRIAAQLGAQLAVTTGSDGQFAFALDNPPDGYVLADPAEAKHAMRAALDGAALRVDGPSDWLRDAGYRIAEDGELRVTVSEASDASGLRFYPKTIVAGVGCARGTGETEILDLIRTALEEAMLAPQSLAAIGTIAIKADEAGLHAAAKTLDVELRLFPAGKLAEIDVPNPSEIVQAETGTPSVAEAAATLAGSLMQPKRKTANATVALGQLPSPDALSGYGRRCGALHLVGIGPGAPELRTFAGRQALHGTTDWVGYGLYLDLISDLRSGQTEHRFDLGDEEVRVRHALELAGQGRDVALVCSGDAQIYAMAALVYELLDAGDSRAVSDPARRVPVECHPGISAFQMASARAGALIGHDFCCVSLSDLLTPRDTVLQRLRAAAEGDFVTALYNPRSRRRIDLLDAAKALFLEHRPQDTPVIVAASLGRPDESVTVTDLAAFDPSTVDMLTIVLFGASQSRTFTRGDGSRVAFTPRGYARKAETAE